MFGGLRLLLVLWGIPYNQLLSVLPPSAQLHDPMVLMGEIGVLLLH